MPKHSIQPPLKENKKKNKNKVKSKNAQVTPPSTLREHRRTREQRQGADCSIFFIIFPSFVKQLIAVIQRVYVYKRIVYCHCYSPLSRLLSGYPSESRPGLDASLFSFRGKKRTFVDFSAVLVFPVFSRFRPDNSAFCVHRHHRSSFFFVLITETGKCRRG